MNELTKDNEFNHGAPILTTNAAGTVVPYPAHAVLWFPGQFASSQQLVGAQHYYNRYRDYDVNTGRYIQADPIGLAGDDNPYAYAGGNPLRYMDPTGEWANVAGGVVLGAGFKAGTQAWQIYKKGGNVFNLRCYDWGRIGFYGALGAFGGELLAPTLKLTKGSMLFSNVSKRIRRAHNFAGKPIDLHHGILPRRWEKFGPWAQGIVNHPANLRAIGRPAHNALHREPSLMRYWGGLPRWAQTGIGSIGLGTGVEAFDGD